MSAPSSDRNLLFGILALQVNFLTRDALLRGMNAWVLEKHRPLGAILVEQGALRQEQHAALQEIVRMHLEAHGNDAHKSLAAVNGAGVVRADLEQIADPAVQASLATLPPGSRGLEFAPPVPPPAGNGTTDRAVGLRYRPLREHAKGGLGEVFVALDEELKREVALKQIQENFADHSDSRARFLREAEITGHLEHPGVVPVYGLGVYPDGRPYYAMRFIRGESMEAAIERFHQADEQPGRDSGERSLALRELLGRFVAVCQAVAYAHARGVIHRDLKPANVMLGEYGETLVVDWGLAKTLGQAESTQTVAERPVPSASSGATATEMGQVVGTAAFMSPEQANGRLDQVGPRSDVFALGATLYCLLTGQVPYSGHDALIRAALAEVVPARQRKASVPAALEAVCHKAMAARPEDRYLRAQALAEDVERWLADEPVRAWAEPLAVKAGRWVRKNRVLAAATTAALVVALVLGSAGGVWVQQQKEQQRLAHIARQQRAGEQAEAGLGQAAQLRDDYRFRDAEAMLDQVGGWASQAADRALQQRLKQAKDDLELARKLDGVRQRVATRAKGKWGAVRMQAEYPEVLARHGLDVLKGNPAELAETIRKSAVRENIVAALDDWAWTQTDRQRALRLLELANRADEPDPWRQGVRQALARRDRKRMRQLLGETRQGKPTPGVVFLLALALGSKNGEATVLLRQMQRQQPRDFWVNFFLGYRLHEEKKDREAAECFLVAVVLRPDSPHAHTNLGNALQSQGKVEEAIACFRKAISLDPDFAPAHNNLGNALRSQGKVEEAIVCFRKTVSLDADFAPAHNNLGIALKDKGKVEEAIACHRKAIELDPKDTQAHNNLGAALHAQGKVDEAIACYRQAIVLDPRNAPAHTNLGNALHCKGKLDEALGYQRKALELDPRNARVCYNLALVLRDKGRVEEAIACFHKAIALDPKFTVAYFILGHTLYGKGKVEEAIACFQKIITLDPKNASAHTSLGVAWHDKGKLEEAIACYRKALELDPRHPNAQTNLGNSLYARGKVEEAIASYQKALEHHPKDAFAHGALGEALLRQGKFSEAQQSLRRCLALLPGKHPNRVLASRLLLQCQQGRDTNARLQAYLTGKATPADASTCVQMANLARQPFKRLYLTAYRLYGDAFTRQPQLANAYRYNAARAAALAGSGQGRDTAGLDNTQRAKLRYSALSWLQESTSAGARYLAASRPGIAEQVRQALLHWQKDADLAAVRDPALLGKLPEAEQVAWRNLWAQV